MEMGRGVGAEVGGSSVVLEAGGTGSGVLWRQRERSADTLQIGCNAQGIWHFCHRALAAL